MTREVVKPLNNWPAILIALWCLFWMVFFHLNCYGQQHQVNIGASFGVADKIGSIQSDRFYGDVNGFYINDAGFGAKAGIVLSEFIAMNYQAGAYLPLSKRLNIGFFTGGLTCLQSEGFTEWHNSATLWYNIHPDFDIHINAGYVRRLAYFTVGAGIDLWKS